MAFRLGLLAAPLLGIGLSHPALTGGKQVTVEVLRNVAYVEDRDADAVRHRLDLYLPKGHTDFPVLLFAHGGGWKNGSKDEFQFLGQTLAGHGVGVVAVNYR